MTFLAQWDKPEKERMETEVRQGRELGLLTLGLDVTIATISTVRSD